jgi:hypothetical protein
VANKLKVTLLDRILALILISLNRVGDPLLWSIRQVKSGYAWAIFLFIIVRIMVTGSNIKKKQGKG